MNLIRTTYRRAKRLDACGLITGREGMDELARLLFSPQGVEFCTKHQFPDMRLARRFKQQGVEQHGVYVDAGRIALADRAETCLIGGTEATLTYADPSKRHVVVLLHGAKALVRASGYAVVFVYGSCHDGDVEVEAGDFAKVFVL